MLIAVLACMAALAVTTLLRTGPLARSTGWQATRAFGGHRVSRTDLENPVRELVEIAVRDFIEPFGGGSVTSRWSKR